MSIFRKEDEEEKNRQKIKQTQSLVLWWPRAPCNQPLSHSLPCLFAETPCFSKATLSLFFLMLTTLKEKERKGVHFQNVVRRQDDVEGTKKKSCSSSLATVYEVEHQGKNRPTFKISPKVLAARNA